VELRDRPPGQLRDRSHNASRRVSRASADLASLACGSSTTLFCVFMLTSRYEGWGLPATEAMACGAAVVSTRNGGTEDFLVDGAQLLLGTRWLWRLR
jgi:glycosyltransferase involved in cell wall biosynthesis